MKRLLIVHHTIDRLNGRSYATLVAGSDGRSAARQIERIATDRF